MAVDMRTGLVHALTAEDTLSIIVPAHDEARVIGRLLGQLLSSADEGGLDVLVVANGCTDNTAEVAASFAPRVRVVSISATSKREALAEGDRAARRFPHCMSTPMSGWVPGTPANWARRCWLQRNGVPAPALRWTPQGPA